MSPIELSLYSVLFLTIYTVYKATTNKLSLIERERMVKPVREILHDKESPEEVKVVALSLFHMSATTCFSMYDHAKILVNERKTPEFKEVMKVSEEVRKKLGTGLFRTMFLANPHVFVLLALLLIVMVLVLGVVFLIRGTGEKLTRRMGELFSQVECAFMHSRI